MDSIKVSIICNTFNHEKYIEDAIKGFVNQKTDFKYEICIHDDASTDHTKEVILKYERLYPELIHAIIQTENQYSKGISVNAINSSRARGEYIAFCEGDDYWTDPYKLQKQVNLFEKYPDCALVLHGSIIINAKNKFAKRTWLFTNKERKLSVEEVLNARGIVAAHNSYMYRNVENTFPDFFRNLGVWDTTRCIYFALNNSVYYIPELMSVYRVGIKGSWNDRIRLDQDKLVKHYRKEIHFYQELNQYTHFKYDNVISKTIHYLEFHVAVCERRYDDIKKDYKNILGNQSIYQKLSFHAQKILPNLFNLLRVIRFKLWI